MHIKIAETHIPIIQEYYDCTDSGIQLKVVGKCEEKDRFQSERDLRRVIKVLFDEHKIDIALPKVFIEDVKKSIIS